MLRPDAGKTSGHAMPGTAPIPTFKPAQSCGPPARFSQRLGAPIALCGRRASARAPRPWGKGLAQAPIRDEAIGLFRKGVQPAVAKATEAVKGAPDARSGDLAEEVEAWPERPERGAQPGAANHSSICSSSSSRPRRRAGLAPFGRTGPRRSRGPRHGQHVPGRSGRPRYAVWARPAGCRAGASPALVSTRSRGRCRQCARTASTRSSATTGIRGTGSASRRSRGDAAA